MDDNQNQILTLFAIAIMLVVAVVLIVCVRSCKAEEITKASWYSVESCKREGTSGIMANGEILDDNKLTCASWDYDFGTLLKITNLENNKSVIVEVTDRGPAWRLYYTSRTIDLSKKAFETIADLDKGVIRIIIKEIK